LKKKNFVEAQEKKKELWVMMKEIFEQVQ